MDPYLSEAIPQADAINILRKLLYVGINLNERSVKSMVESPEKQSALKYLERVKEG